MIGMLPCVCALEPGAAAGNILNSEGGIFVALTARQLLYLNILVNSGALCGSGFRTAGDMAGQLLPAAEGKERKILENLLADGRLRGMRILRRDCEDWGAGYCVFADGDAEAVVAFRGTTSGREWLDNFTAANRADGAHQLAARKYLDALDLSGYGLVTLTGHSKGGTKAMYCAVASGAADRCVSFDGQGFSDAFVAKYADRIAARRDAIENHSAGGDYINVLLNGIGNSRYYETYNPSGNPFLNHELTAMCDEAGEMHPGAQAPEAREFAAFANSLLQFLPGSRRDAALEFLGKMAALILKGDTETAGADDVMGLIHQRQYRREVSLLLAYIIRCERETGAPIRLLRGLLADMKMDGSIRGIGEKLLDLLAWQADNPLALWGIASGVNILVSDADWSYILELISDAAWLSERMERSA